MEWYQNEEIPSDDASAEDGENFNPWYQGVMARTRSRASPPVTRTGSRPPEDRPKQRDQGKTRQGKNEPLGSCSGVRPRPHGRTRAHPHRTLGAPTPSPDAPAPDPCGLGLFWLRFVHLLF